MVFFCQKTNQQFDKQQLSSVVVEVNDSSGSTMANYKVP
jgi:hypothetical protein